MDRFASRIALALLVSSLACEKKEGERNSLLSLNSTMVCEAVCVPQDLPLTPPPGWVVQDHPSKQGKVLVALTKQDSFTPSINLLENQFSGSLDQFVDVNVTNLRQLTQRFQQLKRVPFQTAGGIAGVKLTCTSVTNKVHLYFSYYLFDWNAESKRVFTCCSLASQSKTMEPVFDGILKTYRPE
jgi:hypothetical protein